MTVPLKTNFKILKRLYKKPSLLFLMLCNRKLLAKNFLYKPMVRSGRIQIHDRLIEELDCTKKFRIGEAKRTELYSVL